MNFAQLKAALNFLFENNVNIEVIVYAILKNSLQIKKLDIKGDDLPGISSIFLSSIRSKIMDETNYRILNLSTADERGRCYYNYDLDVPPELECLESVIGDDTLDNFNYSENRLEEIESFVIVLSVAGNTVTIYKRVTPVEILCQSGYILGFKSNNRMERFRDKLIRISSGFQAIRVNDKIIILDLKAIERSFGFQDIIRREAEKGINKIEEMGIVSDIDNLREMLDDISFARKLTKIATDSPVIQKQIPNDEIISFSKTHPKTKNMRYSENDTKFDLSMKSHKILFLKLLNDDLLTSELTRLYYDSLAKDKIPTDEENNSQGD